MPAAIEDAPAITMSFGHNFWGKDDAGVGPLMERMHNAKQTSDELKSFYSARASIEEEYARKLLNLSKKPLGSHETGSLKTSMDTVRTEVEQMAKQHQNIAAQMKSELEEPLAAFAGGMKERRKIIQNTVEKLLKIKTQQTSQVNKTRDKYEQECLKIKGYLAQGHMVMGQEERRNKAKLEKTQISLAASNTEYENAVKILEETTARWNKEWKAAADKFQDLEEERLDFSKSSLWTFANIASTVCVSDDSSCEKIRLSLETMDVETDIATFIAERGTGHVIPDPPKYINFSRGDVNDSQSEVSEDDNYSVAQFPRSINPAFRSSSPQPSTFSSHHDPNSALAHDLAHRDPTREPIQESQRDLIPEPTREPIREPAREPMRDSRSSYREPMPEPSRDLVRGPPREPARDPMRESRDSMRGSFSMSDPMRELMREPPRDPMMDMAREPPRDPRMELVREPARQPYKTPAREQSRDDLQHMRRESTGLPVHLPAQATRPSIDMRRSMDERQPQRQPALGYPPSDNNSRVPVAEVPHDPYPADGMTMMCRTGPPSDRSSQPASARPTSRDSHSEYATSMSSQDPPSGNVSPTKQDPPPMNAGPAPAREPELTPVETPSEETRSASPDKRMLKKRSGFFQNHSPFRRKSQKDLSTTQTHRNTWHPTAKSSTSPIRRPLLQGRQSFIQPQEEKPQPQQQAPAAPKEQPPPQKPQSERTQTAPVLPVSRPPAQQPKQQPAPQPQFQPQMYPQRRLLEHARTQSPEPIDANASLALGVGQNVLPVTNPDQEKRRKSAKEQEAEELDPIALALAELKGVTKSLGKDVSARMSADHYHGIATPGPGADHVMSKPVPAPGGRDAAAVNRGTPPPSYQTQTPVSRLGVPPPAVTSKAMKAATKKATSQTRDIFGENGRPNTASSKAPSTYGSHAPKAPSIYGSASNRAPSVYGSSSNKAPSVYGSSSNKAPSTYAPSPVSRPGVSAPSTRGSVYSTSPSSRPGTSATSTSRFSASPSTRPGTSATATAPSTYGASPSSRPGTRGTDRPRDASPAAPRDPSPHPTLNNSSSRMSYRSASPNPYAGHQRTSSGMSESQKRGSNQGYYPPASPASRTASPATFTDYNRPPSSYSTNEMAMQLAPISNDPYGSQRSRDSRPGSRAMGLYEGGAEQRQRGGSVADPSRLYTPDGRPILHYARALYMYQAAIPEELGFAKGDYLAVVRHQDDGWWEAEVHGGNGGVGLVPSNYLQPC